MQAKAYAMPRSNFFNESDYEKQNDDRSIIKAIPVGSDSHS